MKTNKSETNSEVNKQESVIGLRGSASSMVQSDVANNYSELVYRELDSVPVKRVDPVLESQRQLDALEELQQRMSFMLKEVRSMIKG